MSEATETIDEAVQPSTDKWDRKRVAESIVRRHSALAAGAGLVPVPVFDFAALTGVQLNQIQRLADLYDVPFTKELGKNTLISLAGVALPMSLQMTGVGVLKAIPYAGTFAGSIALPALAAGFSYAVGHVMIRHFESGGTLLNFDSKEAQAYFKEKIKEGTESSHE